MVHAPGDDADSEDIHAVLDLERARLTRLCARITGDPSAADELAQETLIEAWRHHHKLRNPEVQTAWLSGIARNVCRRWARERGRELARMMPPGQRHDATHTVVREDAIADATVDSELERHELLDLLDRALAMLPAASRQVLIARYLHEAPQAEVAARLGISEGAVAMRVSRGKLALRRVLMEELHAEAAAYGIGSAATGWQPTRLWCPRCGQQPLTMKPTLARGEFILHCQACSTHPDDHFVHSKWSPVFEGAPSSRAALERMMRWTTDYYTQGLPRAVVPCVRCNRPAPLRRTPSPGAPAWLDGIDGLHHACAVCRQPHWHSLTSYALFSSAGRRFYRAYPRIRTVPLREVVGADGRKIIVASFESMTDTIQLDVLMAHDTLEILSSHRSAHR